MRKYAVDAGEQVDSGPPFCFPLSPPMIPGYLESLVSHLAIGQAVGPEIV